MYEPDEEPEDTPIYVESPTTADVGGVIAAENQQ